jgi:2-polyprenyl-6-methoxyphenol hydroxylase-like FAD-dependent oxidoreductase
MPKLRQTAGEFRVTGAVKVRPMDLYATENVHQHGIALVGDAFATACPTSGTGASKAIVDVERLCNVHVPQWLATAGMSVEKVAAFYADPEKTRSDVHSMKASLFAKRIAIETEFRWSAYRLVRFAGSVGMGLLKAWDEPDRTELEWREARIGMAR